MPKMDMTVHQVIYLEESTGLPQIGHYVQNPARPTDVIFFPYEGIMDMFDIADEYGFNLILRDSTEFIGTFPPSLVN